jgi:hypothetical protein
LRYDKWKIGAAAALSVVALAVGLTVFSNPSVESPGQTYGFMPVSTSSGLLDIGALSLAGEAPSEDATAPKYKCHDNSYYIDQDGERGVKYYSGEHLDISPGYYFYGYDHSYADAQVCGGLYNYQCEMGSGCDGYVSSDPDDGSDSGSSEGSDSGSNDGGGTDTNEPPEIENIDTPSTVNVSQPFTVSVEASDPDSVGLEYSWSNGKTGQSIILNYGEPGVKELDVTVSDDAGNTAEATVQINVRSTEVVTDPKPEQPEDVGLIQQIINWFTGLFE